MRQAGVKYVLYEDHCEQTPMCQLYRVTTLEQQVTYSHYAGGGAELMVNLVATLGLVTGGAH